MSYTTTQTLVQIAKYLFRIFGVIVCFILFKAIIALELINQIKKFCISMITEINSNANAYSFAKQTLEWQTNFFSSEVEKSFNFVTNAMQ